MHKKTLAKRKLNKILAKAKAMQKKLNADKNLNCFKELDKNDNGSVSKAEFDTTGLQKIRKCIIMRHKIEKCFT
jgi:recombinational DNA repair protein RecT